MRALLLTLLLVTAASAGSLRLPKALGSGMVVQRGLPIPIWGWAAPGAAVRVYVDFQSQETKALADGTWKVSFPARTSSFLPLVIRVEAPDTKESITLTDVLVGDVFLCSGQSNMQQTVTQTFNATAEIADSIRYPELRLLTVWQNISLTPLDDLISTTGWQISSPGVVGAGAWTQFSATCYYTVRDYLKVAKVPVGAITTCWGGTYIQAWSSPDALAKCPTANVPPYLTTSDRALALASNDNPNQPSVLWNAMIVPFLKLPVRAFLWYQGEANTWAYQNYGCQFKAMIADWRTKWGLGNTPFMFVQISTWTDDNLVSYERRAQLAGLELPNVGCAVAADLGDPTSPWDPIHPRDKQTVGHRLHLHARKYLLGEATLVVDGPIMAGVVTAPAPVGKIAFDVSYHSAVPLLLKPTATSGFEIGSSETAKSWVACDAALLSAGAMSIRVTCPTPPAISAGSVGLRYAWADWPVCSVYNAADLPAWGWLVTVPTA